MPDAASTLRVQVRTGEAARDVRNLAKALFELGVAAKAVKNVTIPAAAASSLQKTGAAAAATTDALSRAAAEVDALEKAEGRGAKTAISYSTSVGGVTQSIRQLGTDSSAIDFILKQTAALNNSDLGKWRASMASQAELAKLQMAAIAEDRRRTAAAGDALEKAQNAAILEDRRRTEAAIESLSKKQTAAIIEDRRREAAAAAAMAKAETAAIAEDRKRTDAIDRANAAVEKANTAQLLAARAAALKQLVELEQTAGQRRARGVVASETLFADALREAEASEKSFTAGLLTARAAALKQLVELEQTAGQRRARGVLAANTLFAEALQQEQSLADAAAARRAATQARQLQLNSAYYEKDLSQRIAYLERAARLQATDTVSSATLMRRFGGAAMGDMASLPALQAEKAAQAEATAAARQGLGTSKEINTERAKGQLLLKANEAAIQDAHSAARGLLGTVRATWLTWGNIAPLAAGALAGAAAVQTISVGAKLESRLKMVEALGNTPVMPAQLTPAIQDTTKTPLEAAEALQALAQAGLSTKDALATLGPVIQLSTLGELDMETAAVSVTAALNAFDLSAQQAGRVGDVFAMAAADSTTSVQKIAESMKQASTNAAQFNISLEETTAAIDIMAKRNITGTLAGTAFRNMTKELYAPIARGAQALKQLGVSAYTTNGQMKAFPDVLRELDAALANLDAQSRNSALEAIFGERGARAAKPLLEDLHQYTEEVNKLGEAQGFLARAAATYSDTVQGAGQRLNSAMQQSFARSFDEISPQLRDLLQSLTEIAGSDGAVDVVTGISRAFISGAEAVIAYRNVLGGLGVAWLGLRGTSLALQAIMTLQARALELNTSRTTAETVALAANTTEQRVNAASRVLSDAAAAGTVARAGTVASGASRMATALTWVSRLSGWMGPLALGIMAVSTAVEYYVNKEDEADKARDRAVRKVKSLNEELEREIKNQEDANAKALNAIGTPKQQVMSTQDQFLGDATSRLEASRSRLEDLQRVLLLKQNINAADVAQYDAIQKQRKEGKLNLQQESALRAESLRLGTELNGVQKSIVLLLQQTATAQQDVNKAAAERERTERNIKKLIEDQQKAQAIQKFASAEGVFERIDKGRQHQLDIIANSKNSANVVEARKKLAVYDKYYVPDYIQKAGEATKSADAQKAYQALATKADIGLSDDLDALSQHMSFGSRGAGRIFGAQASAIKAEFEREKHLIEQMRDAELAATKKLEDAGVITSQQAADRKSQIWDKSTGKIVAQAGAAAARIKAAGGGQEELASIKAGALVQEAADQRKAQAQRDEIDRLKEITKLQADAAIISASTAGDIQKIQAKIKVDDDKRRENYASAFMDDSDIAAMEARRQAMDAYNSAIEKVTKTYQALVALYHGDAGAVSAHGGDELLASLNRLKAQQAVSGAQAATTGKQEYLDSNDWYAGMMKTFAQYRNEGMNTGKVVGDSLSKAFGDANDALTNFALTGKLSFRDLTVSILQDLSKIAMQMATSQLFGMIGKLIGSATGGGLNGATTGAAIDNGTSTSFAVSPSAKGNVFASADLSRYSGGVYDTPHLFRFAKGGVGEFAEAGPEGILPLKRGPGGVLGVRAYPAGVGAGAASVVNVSTVVNVASDGSATTSVSSSDGGYQKMGDQITQAVTGVIQRHLRQGGMINMAIRAAR